MQTFPDLVAGMDAQYLCDYLQITKRTLARWKNGTATPPHSAILALQIKLDGNLSALGGNAWKGFFLRDGKLYAPFFERGITPDRLNSLFFAMQELRALRLDAKKAREVRAVEVWASDKLNGLICAAVLHRIRYRPASTRLRKPWCAARLKR